VSVVDASVIVAAGHRDEPEHAASREWLRRALAEGRTPAAPTILLPKVASALARTTGDAELAKEFAQALRRSVLAIEAVTEALAARAGDLAAEHGLRGCDAVYVALAERLGEDLVTLDQHQLACGSAVVTTSTPG
jgi:predicted nucleic acid-binding protein